MGDFTAAARVSQLEVNAATNDDRRVSMAHWLYMSLRRSGRDAEAAQVLVPITRDMTIIENQAYHRLMLLYKGALPADSVLRRPVGRVRHRRGRSGAGADHGAAAVVTSRPTLETGQLAD